MAGKTIGVLALQGAVTPHLEKIKAVGFTPQRVTSKESLAVCDRIILPGGESTTMLKLIDSSELWQPLLTFFKEKPTWGTCAGAILLAKKVINPAQRSFEVIDIQAERNAYGSQLDSFKTTLTVTGIDHQIEADFIRAPKLTALSNNVEVLAEHDGNEVMLRQGVTVVTSFHSELGNGLELHDWFCRTEF